MRPGLLQWLFVCALAVVCWPCSFARAAPTLELGGGEDGQTALGTLGVFEDKSAELTFSDVSADKNAAQFQLSNSDAPNFGFTRSNIWLRLPVHNAGSERHYLLELAYPHLDHADLYVQRPDGRVQLTRGGDNLPFAQRAIRHRSLSYDIELEPGAEATLYLNVHTQGSLQLPLRLWTIKGFAEAKLNEAGELYGYYGIILVMIFYNLFLYLGIRDSNYLIYVCYLVGFLFYQLTLNGLAFEYLWPNSPGFNNMAVPPLGLLVGSLLTVFTRRFLRTSETVPRLDPFLRLQIAAMCSALLLSPFVSLGANIKLMAALSMMGCVSLLSTGVTCLVRGNRSARFFVLAFVAFFIGVAVLVARTYGAFRGASLAIDGMQVGSAVEIILLSLALGDRIKSEQLGNQQRIERLNAELIEKERARTTFFHNTSHELRTPLNGMLAFVDLLGKGHYGAVSERARTQLDKVGNLGRSLLHQVNAILDLAKSRGGQLKLVNTAIPLGELVEEARAVGEGLTLRPGMHDFALHEGFTGAPPMFVGDREKLAAIVRNLLGNAFKFAAPERKNHVELSLSVSSERVLQVRVSDSGIGIAPRHHQEIFEEFKQVGDDSARRAHEGTGLGLALVKRLVELMGGSIRLESELGQGSTFTVQIPEQSVQHAVQRPVAQAPLPGPAGAANDNERLTEPGRLISTGKQSARVLVVDDNEINGEVVRDVLGAYGYEVIYSARGKEALDYMRKKPPDLLLLDLMMPEMSGEDVLREMKQREELANIPVLVLTARASDEDRLLALTMGADDYLAKPLLGDELVLRVHNTLARLGLVKALAERRAIEESLMAAQKVLTALGREGARVPNLSVSEHYQSAESTSGDWFGMSYDAARRRLYTMIGDVTGHGMTSALITVAASGAAKGCLSALRDTRAELDMPSALRTLCKAVNLAVRDAGEGNGRTMTMAFVCIDLVTGDGAYLNAGHNEVYVLSGPEVSVLLERGQPLGLSAEPQVGECRFHLGAQNGLFMHTDGLIENTGPAGEVLGKRALLRVLKSQAEPHELKAQLLERCHALWGEQPPEDDCAFVAMRLERHAASDAAE